MGMLCTSQCKHRSDVRPLTLCNAITCVRVQQMWLGDYHSFTLQPYPFGGWTITDFLPVLGLQHAHAGLPHWTSKSTAEQDVLAPPSSLSSLPLPHLIYSPPFPPPPHLPSSLPSLPFPSSSTILPSLPFLICLPPFPPPPCLWWQ